MSANELTPLTESANWRELRDERGKLCARLDSASYLLEVRRSDRDLVAYFDLRDYFELLRDVSLTSVE